MAVTVREVLVFIGRSGRRVAVSVVGAVVMLAGLAMFVLPGPGILVVALGLAILATEYTWAAVALERTKSTAAKAGGAAKGAARRVFRRR